MTRFIHDQFAKDYLEQLLSPYGEVQAPRRVSGEVRQIDVWFAPNSPQSANASEILGLLGRLAATPSIFEPFRNPATPNEISDCLLKLWEIRGELQREANRNNTNIAESALPKLWILTPTESAGILSGFGAIINDNWLPGIYLMPEYLRTGIVVIHQLPRTPETLWLRILGKGNVQKQAIDEIVALSADNPLRSNAVKLLYNLRKNLQINDIPDEEDRELIMRLAPLYEQDRERAIQEGIQQGIQQGIQAERRQIVENLLQVRFGLLDEQLAAIIPLILTLPPAEFTPMLLQLSRAELLARFAEQN
ncbi:hypothetical protein [Aerosakkonema funiforme]|uniref:Flagellar assembly protein H n=1 Tax=Aerosakkonema funiforme FACHB-1375 TaxID=2949571 RepID=A0A926VAU5_9CYAN|nr:hypothetical protein [Aerosakkonema funiforme]MBD2179532.1 hypothetical protein [Aerosakkonema funiforme FACHB-1375]